MKRQGFTLIELLAVIGVITIMAAILFPVFIRVREKGRQATCQGNLRQLALAMQMYMQDHDGQFPVITEWNKALIPYAKNTQIFYCPSSPHPVNSGQPSYGLNYGLNELRFGQNVGRQDATLANPATTFLNGDILFNYVDIATPCGLSGGYVLHFNGADYSFVDGHVKWLTPKQHADMSCINRRGL